MARKFTDEDRKEPERPEYTERMPFGVSQVKLVGATYNEPEGKSEYMEITVINDEGVEDSLRLYFSEKAAPYSIDKIRTIAVHNAKTDAAKEKARLAIDSVEDGEALADLINTKMAGNELWYTRYYDTEQKYVARDNKHRRRVNTNIYGYEPKVNEDLLALRSTDEDDEITSDNVASQFPDGEKQPASNIPKGW